MVGLNLVNSALAPAVPRVAQAFPALDSLSTSAAGGFALDVIDPLVSRDEWDRELLAYPTATVFHSAAWAGVLASTYGHRPFYLRLRQGNGIPILIPVMEVKSPLTGRRGVCLPFSDSCGPLLPDGIPFSTLREPLEAVTRERGWKYLELRGNGADGDFSPPTFYGHELDLRPGADALWQGLSGSVRRALRKAENHGLQLRVAHDEAAVKMFFALHTLTRQRHGIPAQPYAFFRNLHREKVIGPGAGFVVSAEWRGRLIAASVFLRQGTLAIYKFGASDEGEWKCRPNHFVMWEAIRHLAATGSRSLHFGRTSIDQEGLRRFKLSWGASEHTIPYIQYHPRTASWQPVTPKPDNRLVQSIFQRLPLAVNRFAGRILYQHFD